jgi:hypothetical protein
MLNAWLFEQAIEEQPIIIKVRAIMKKESPMNSKTFAGFERTQVYIHAQPISTSCSGRRI